MSEEEKKAIEIVKHFNKENIYRDCGRINNAIDTVITLAEKLEQEKEKNKKIEDKIKEKINYLQSLEFESDLVTQSTANLTTLCILQELLED